MIDTASAAPPIVRRVSDLIGSTPLLELCRTADGGRLLLKLESLNPTGSAKARMARQMVIDAERDGTLRPGGRIVESTSALGAELVYVTTNGDEDLATAAREELAERLAAQQPNAIFTEQHNNPSNADGYEALAEELAAALPDGIDHLVGAVGTGGSLCGTARGLRDRFPQLAVIGVEPVGSIAFGGPGGPYYQSGTGTPPGAALGALVEYDLIDTGRKVSDRAAFATARVLARETGVLVGGSAGGVVHEALRELARGAAPKTMVALICDAGEKYLDSVFDDDWMQERELLDPALEAEVAGLLDELSAG